MIGEFEVKFNLSGTREGIREVFTGNRRGNSVNRFIDHTVEEAILAIQASQRGVYPDPTYPCDDRLIRWALRRFF